MVGNHTVIAGQLMRVAALRYTPAGVPCARASLWHSSEQPEAGAARRVEFEIEAVGFGDTASRLAQRKSGDRVRLAGFLAPRAKGSPILELHVNEIECE